MNSQFEVKISLFPYGYKNSYRLTLELAPGKISSITDAFINSTQFKELLANKDLINEKGRDPKLSILEPKVPLKRNELLLLAGKIYGSELDASDSDFEKFQLSITTPFVSSKKNHMHHAFHYEHYGFYPEFLNLQVAARIIPAEIDYFRFGLMTYSKRCVFNIFGFAPVLTGRLLIDSSKDKFSLLVYQEGLSKKTSIPLFGKNILGAVDLALQKACSFSVLEDMQLKSEQK